MEMKHKSELWHHRFHTHKNAQNHPYFFGSYLWLKMIDFDWNCVIMKKKKKQMIDFDVFNFEKGG